MMLSSPPRVAIYARYSSELQNSSSVDDQIALCRGLIVEQFRADPAKAAVYSDAAISGATMERPGIIGLLASAKAGRIDLVVTEGIDRLSRSLKDIAAFYETLNYHGVTIWTAHEGRVSELHIGLKGTMNALFLRDLKSKIQRGHKARIAAGFAASSCAYGYRVVRGVLDHKGANVNGVREIDEAAAAIIRRIYQEYINGRKIPAIVAGLNGDGIPAPAGGLWKRNALMGGAKKQEGILRNEIYLGKLIFNRSHVVRDPVSNKKRFVLNPESEWTKVEVPHLRIINDELWAAARALDLPRRSDGKKREDPSAPAAPRILKTHNQHALTGWIKCGWCGGPKSLANESRYLCSTHRYAKKCKNSRGMKEPVLMVAVFEALQARIADGPAFHERFIHAFAREARQGEKLQKLEADIKGRIGRLMNAIERGVNEEEASRRVLVLQAELARVRHELRADIPLALPDEASIRATLSRAVREVELSGDVKRTRLMFECLLRKVVLTPIPNQPRGETYEITLREEGWPDFWRLATSG
jgi:site-specific DNA recombinase